MCVDLQKRLQLHLFPIKDCSLASKSNNKAKISKVEDPCSQVYYAEESFSSATRSPIFMQFTLSNNGGTKHIKAAYQYTMRRA